MNLRRCLLCSLLPFALLPFSLLAQQPVSSPKEFLGFNIGDDYQVASYSQLESYWKKLATQTDRLQLVDIGKTGEGRTQYMAVISSPANLKNLARYKEISSKLAHAEGLTEAAARELAHEGKAIVWIVGGRLLEGELVLQAQVAEAGFEIDGQAVLAHYAHDGVRARAPELLAITDRDARRGPLARLVTESVFIRREAREEDLRQERLTPRRGGDACNSQTGVMPGFFVAGG